MAYGTVKVDSITFTNGGADQTITVSGIVQSISGDITATGTIQGATIIGTSTVSGATVTGDSGQYGNLNSVSGVFTTQISGATITGDIGQYATVTGISGVFTTAISGATITGDAGNYSELTAISGVFTTQVSGATVTGDAGVFTTVTGGSAGFTTVTGTTVTGTTANFATLSGTTITGSVGNFGSGSAAAPSVSVGTTDNGIYSPGADQVAISTSGTGKLFIDSAGKVTVKGVGTAAFVVEGTAPDNSLFVKGSTGNVGLGTSSPGVLLDAAGSNPTLRVRATTANTEVSTIRLTEDNNYVGAYLKYDGSSNLTHIGTHSAADSDAANDNHAITIVRDTRNVGVGTTQVDELLHVESDGATPKIKVESTLANSSPGFRVTNDARSYDIRIDGTNDNLQFYDATASQGRVAIDSSGRLLVGTSSSADQNARIQSATNSTNVFEGFQHDANTFGAVLRLAKSRGSVGTTALVSDDDELGRVAFLGSDNTNYRNAASIAAFVDGTPGANDMPGRLVFSTTADGASSPTPRVTLDKSGIFHSGTVFINATNATDVGFGFQQNGFSIFARSEAQAINVCRRTNDGDLVHFYQDATQEGSISVSGATVSYNGAHLSRWSQLSGIDPYDKTVRPEILRGTVMSNLDEMCDWTCPTSGDCQDNEQLNKTKISDVEGDKNVAGVFQSWDDDDDVWVNDFYLAMTGDFVIRIAAGVTVQRGDLLMSAGDGTAKPQDDDIIRSKTVAKVTSTNVSCTHPDGSYCVPCVLMAC